MKITKKQIEKLSTVIDAGLCHGVGKPIPGQMCVEAAVCYALDLPHGDEPPCVSAAVRAVKITLNDSAWSSNKARAKGLKKLAVAQLGSKGIVDDKEFAIRLAVATVQKIVPRALRLAAKLAVGQHGELLEAEAKKCEQVKDKDAATAAYAAAYAAARAAAYAAARAAAARAARAAAYADADAARAARAAAAAAAAAADAVAYADADADAAAARDKELTFFADVVLEILVDMQSPGVKFLRYLKD